MRQAQKQRDLKVDLRSYRKNMAELDKIQSRLEALGETVAVQASASENFRKQVRRVYGLPPTDEVRRLKARRKELWSITTMCEYWISSIPNERTRDIFRRHFINGEKYTQIAEFYGIEVESVRKLVQRKLKSP